LLGPLTLRLDLSGEACPGKMLEVSIHVISSTGLEVMDCTVSLSGSRAVGKAADLRLDNADGQTVDRARTGFT
jgi:hypothetical protein